MVDDCSQQCPSRIRLGVLAFLCTLSFLLYLDRVCISQALPAIRQEMQLTNFQISLVLNAFMVAYAIFEIPTGRWGDRFGSRRVLTRVVVWWSLFTMLTAACTGLWSLIMMRFLFGAGEAGAYPNAARIIRNWFPVAERGRAQGLMLASSLVGGAVAPIAVGYLIQLSGWRSAFIVFGAIGPIWAAAFYCWFRDDPTEHPGVNAEERLLIAPAPEPHATLTTHAPIPWRAIFHSRSMWFLAAINVFAASCSYLYYSWYPTYLQSARGASPMQSAWLSALVLVGGMIGLLAGGFVSDQMVLRARNLRAARARYGLAVGLVASGLLVAGTMAESAEGTAMFMSASCLVLFLQLPMLWSSIIEIGGHHVGSMLGLLNMCGLAGGAVSQFMFGAIADWRQSQGFSGREQWDTAFIPIAVVLVLNGICWSFVDTSRPVDYDGQSES